jgi:hypothetical protein
MTLRAIGNLTRTDENILRAVGFGVVRGIVEGMAKHRGAPDVLKLCADVIGNMSSIDPRKFAPADATRVLKETVTKSGGASGVGAARVSAAVGALERGESDVKEAVCSILFADGGAGALIDAMLAHPTRADLASSCLRALH